MLISDFNQKFYLDKGITGGTRGRIMVCDSDRDNRIELIFAYYENLQEKVVVYELYPDNNFYLEAIIDTTSGEAWEIGDFDNDGFFDLILTGDFGLPVVGLQIYESSDSFSYPAQEVWRDTVGFALVTPICTYDVDQDGLPEIVKVIGDTTDFDIYECTGNNSYARIFQDTILEGHSPKSTVAFGDFDADISNELILGYTGGEYSIWECTGDNTYQEILFQQIPIPSSISDCFTVFDSDGDGWLEFVLKGHVLSVAEVNTYIFEATADNTYQIIKSFILPGGSFDYYGGYSDAGDVDGDSVPEIVLEACQYVYIIKSAGNDSFYVWDTLPGNWTGSCVRVTDDIDGNGLNEIVISGGNTTRIYEYEPSGIEELEPDTMPYALRLAVFPNPFHNQTRIKVQQSRVGIYKLDIYNVLGQNVRSLWSGYQTAGVQEVVWDGCDDRSGRKVPQGIYFVRVDNLATGESSVSKVLKVR